MRLHLVDEERSDHSVSRLCRALGVTRAGYHAWRKRPPSRRALAVARLQERIRAAHAASRGTYGAPRLHVELRAQSVRIARKRVARLLRQAGLEGVSRRHAERRPTSLRAQTAAPDLVRRSFRADQLDALWLADITYVPTHEGWLFLAVVVDACSRRIAGWSMSDDLTIDPVVDAISMAAARRPPAPGLVHHSDPGAQYRSLAFERTLHDSGIVASMGSRSDAYENAATEIAMSTIKVELVRRQSFRRRDQARLDVFSYIEGFYNPLRCHSALGYLSPVELEERMGKEQAAVPVAS